LPLSPGKSRNVFYYLQIDNYKNNQLHLRARAHTHTHTHTHTHMMEVLQILPKKVLPYLFTLLTVQTTHSTNIHNIYIFSFVIEFWLWFCMLPSNSSVSIKKAHITLLAPERPWPAGCSGDRRDNVLIRPSSCRLSYRKACMKRGGLGHEEL